MSATTTYPVGNKTTDQEDMKMKDEIDEEVRIVEAILFASSAPVGEVELIERLPEGTNIPEILEDLTRMYSCRGVNLVKVGGKWAFRTAPDLSFLLQKETVEQRKLSRAALETLAIIAYHQPITRAEIEEIRGVSISKGTLDVLLSIGWIRMRGRRKSVGRPVTYGTTENFLDHFMLESVGDLPGLSELQGAGLLDNNVPAGFSVPLPSDDPTLQVDEEPLEEDDVLDGLEFSQNNQDNQNI